MLYSVGCSGIIAAVKNGQVVKNGEIVKND